MLNTVWSALYELSCLSLWKIYIVQYYFNWWVQSVKEGSKAQRKRGLPRVTQLINGRTRFQTGVSLISKVFCTLSSPVFLLGKETATESTRIGWIRLGCNERCLKLSLLLGSIYSWWSFESWKDLHISGEYSEYSGVWPLVHKHFVPIFDLS